MASPLWGYVCDHLIAPEYVQVVGSCTMCFGFALVGPAPYLPIPSSYPVIVIGLAFLGIGTAASLVASFSGALKAALSSSTSSGTFAAISGVWTSAFALGNFIGPSLGGILFDLIDFRHTTLVFQLTAVVLICVDTFRVCQLKQNVVLKKVDVHKMDLYEKL